MSRIINSVFSDSTSEGDGREYQRVAYETEPPAAAEALIPSTRVQMDGSVTVHRKHRKITVRGLGTSHKKKQSVLILKELKKSNEALAQKLRKTEKKILNMEDKLRCATSINKGKSSRVPNGVRVINIQ